MAAASCSPSSPGSDLKGESDGGELHVLAVDDSVVERMFLERMLKKSEYKVTTAENGTRALEYLGLLGGEEEGTLNKADLKVNLIITDYCMPGMTGYELMKKIKEISYLKEIPVVIMSSENNPTRIEKCLEDGAKEFMLKPIKQSDVKRLSCHVKSFKRPSPGRLLFAHFVAISSGHRHPLDPLSPSEISTIRSIIKSSSLLSPAPLGFHYVGLDEPDKHAVLSWKSDPSSHPLPPRRAFAILRSDGQTYELHIDLDNKSIASHRRRSGVSGHPMLNMDERNAVLALPFKYAPFVDSVKKRGVELRDVVCSTLTMGWFGEEQDQRLVKMQCFVTGETVNLYMRPIEGITMVVDMETVEIVEYEDRVVIAMPTAAGTEYRASRQLPPYGPRGKPVVVTQPVGKGFTFEGNVVRWANWNFHVGFDSRVGLVISVAGVGNGKDDIHRSVLYRGYLSEVYVPYMDPSEEWYFKTYFDIGEYGFASTSFSLKAGIDCPHNAEYMDGYYANGDGSPVLLRNAICIFERYAGDVSWRHTETLIPGRIAGFTGVLEVRATDYNHVEEMIGEQHGTLLAPNTIGVFHDHFLTYHLDLDVDGPENSFVKANLRTVRAEGGTTPRKSYWTVVSETARTEADARIAHNEARPGRASFVNPG
ncbi:hypothetical protein HPP92_015594 [Vanilla planifolia]|uniref:Amine oxidase n=1 Tax=Vanilla planifolia TaxID=51239 RepID=A0A835UTU1_VANPL|nr:hypothetical protein HPP92_015594 [Vanilla planifolia]